MWRGWFSWKLHESLRPCDSNNLYEAGLPEKGIMKRSGHRSIEGVRAYQREDPNNKIAVSNVLSCSKSVVPSSCQKNVVSSSSCVSNNVELNKDDDDWLLLMKACEDYEKSVSNIHLGGIFQEASQGWIQTVLSRKNIK